MSIGTLASGVLAYAFNVLAARVARARRLRRDRRAVGRRCSCSPCCSSGRSSRRSRARWPTTSPAARTRRPAVRSAAWLTALITAGAVAGCVLAWTPITDRLFGGEPILTVALVAGLAGYGALLLRARPRRRRPVVRRLRPRAAGRRRDPLRARAPPAHRRLADGGRCGDRRGGRRRCPGAARSRASAARCAAWRAPSAATFALGSAVRFALPAAVIAGAEQVLVSGGPLLVLIAGGEGAAAAAGVLFAATLLVRAPGVPAPGRAGVAAAEPDHLPRPRRRGEPAPRDGQGRGDARRLRGRAGRRRAGRRARSRWSCCTATSSPPAGSISRCCASASAASWPPASSARPRSPAARRGRPRAAGRPARSPFVALELTLSGTAFHRVSIAFAAGSVIAGLLLMRTLWRSRS